MDHPLKQSQTGRLRVVVIGAGFGGIAVGRSLRRLPVDLTIVDRRNFHLFQPLLYQVATAALSPGDISWPIRSIFSRQENARVVMMNVSSVDTRARTISDGVEALGYDILVLATGATHAYFGHEDWEKFAPGLKTVDDARAIREHILYALEMAERTNNPDERHKFMSVVIVGGGATGVEMAGAVAELAHRTLVGQFRNIDTREIRIVLMEAGPRLLPAFPCELSDKAETSLTRMGIEVRTRTPVVDCHANGVSVAGENKPRLRRSTEARK
ncbi:NAD(P)/FAD-dependent oxidoreductase [Rhizobium sp. WYJ-E13]|uniref:NAD(P)/FAD-dependent oxidoreductase n=1 Tax=Rhizobium sp. WYJ-E13 TaxID=2849093 RepID=UPI001C1F1796|nr:FAD-dependent oxidoreductase [Rhizobium sp. WYJ-E13]QWW72550.1 FAD-dependent oxidoreductase [Rhizobium sp. WYJ-E13]